MKAERITFQMVKNLGNYETVRFEIEYSLNENDNIQDAFITAKNELDVSFNEIYKKKEPDRQCKLPILTPESEVFNRVCKSLHDGRTDLHDLQKYFQISESAIIYFKNNKLI